MDAVDELDSSSKVLPAAAPEPAAQPASRLDALRRFHFGERAATLPPVPARSLPAALDALRGVIAVRTGWPLLVDPEAATFALPFDAWLVAQPLADRALADNRARLERRVLAALADGTARPARGLVERALGSMLAELGLGAGDEERCERGAAAIVESLSSSALLVPYGAAAPARVAELAARRRLEGARRRLAAEVAELGQALAAILVADRERSGEEPAGGGRLGVLGDRFVDPSRLAGVIAHRKLGSPLAGERRRRLQAAAEELAAALEPAPAPLWILAPGFPATGLEATHVAADPCAAAASAFDARAASAVELLRAVRLARLEIGGALDPERHLPGLERLDWRALAADELALVPPVLVALTPADLGGPILASLVALLDSGRPVQVLVLDRAECEADAATPIRFDIAALGLGLRELYVHRGSPARGEELARGFERAAAGSRPALHVVDLPAFSTIDLDPWLVASARVSGRAAPIYRYEPEAGASWARRFRLDGDPQPEADWPEEPLAERVGAAGAPPALPFTYADAALLDPAWREHFAPVAADEPGDDLVPLADWLELAPEPAAKKLPTILGATPAEGTVRLVVTRTLAWATRDHLGAWRNVRELAGIRNEHVEQAAFRAHQEAERNAAAEREQLAARHAAELDQVRRDADERAVDRLIAALFEVEPTFAATIGAGERSAAKTGPAEHDVPSKTGPKEETTPSTEAPSRAQESFPQSLRASSPTPTGRPAATPEPGGATEAEAAWIDTALCTSCDECTRKYPSIFAYNADKQAYVANPRGGTFKDLVQAAEACTAKIIHPGTPWNAAEPDLAALVERAKPFA